MPPQQLKFLPFMIIYARPEPLMRFSCAGGTTRERCDENPFCHCHQHQKSTKCEDFDSCLDASNRPSSFLFVMSPNNQKVNKPQGLKPKRDLIPEPSLKCFLSFSSRQFLEPFYLSLLIKRGKQSVEKIFAHPHTSPTNRQHNGSLRERDSTICREGSALKFLR